MRVCLFFILFTLIASISNASYIRGGLELGYKYDTNLYYSTDTPEAGSVGRLHPEVDMEYSTEKVFTYFDAEAEMLQTKSSNSETKSLHNETDANVGFGLGSRDQSWMSFNFNSFSRENPLFSATAADSPVFSGTHGHFQTGFGFWKKHHIKLSGDAFTENVNQENYRYLNSKTSRAALSYSYYFLPETLMFIELASGDKKFENGTEFYDLDNNDKRLKYDADITEVNFGIKGRLTKYTSIDFGFGYKDMKYKGGKSFAEPVFHVLFTDQISPKDSIMAGYMYASKDSTYTNWVLEQDMHIGYSRIMRDTFLFMMKLSYIYYSYSEPFRREDQRLVAKFRLDWVFRPKWTVITSLNADKLVSDAYDTNTSSSDRPASYDAAGLGIAIKRSF